MLEDCCPIENLEFRRPPSGLTSRGDYVNWFTAETLLAKAGCDVTTAIDGFDALAKIADTQPAIIFVDIMMPRLDGYQTCALIKNNKAFKKTPVIMLSSKDGLFDRAKGRIVGSDQYLTKPFSKDELLSAIRDHVKVVD